MKNDSEMVSVEKVKWLLSISSPNEKECLCEKAIVIAQSYLLAMEKLQELENVRGELDMANDALIEARATLIKNGFPDLPFLDDGIQNAINELRKPTTQGDGA